MPTFYFDDATELFAFIHSLQKKHHDVECCKYFIEIEIHF